MTLHNFISRLNWRQILLHLIAFWFFIYAFETFAYLTDTKLIELFRHSDQQITRTTLEENGISSSNITDLLFTVTAAGLSGFLPLPVSVKKTLPAQSHPPPLLCVSAKKRDRLCGWFCSKAITNNSWGVMIR